MELDAVEKRKEEKAIEARQRLRDQFNLKLKERAEAAAAGKPVKNPLSREPLYNPKKAHEPPSGPYNSMDPALEAQFIEHGLLTQSKAKMLFKPWKKALIHCFKSYAKMCLPGKLDHLTFDEQVKMQKSVTLRNYLLFLNDFLIVPHIITKAEATGFFHVSNLAAAEGVMPSGQVCSRVHKQWLTIPEFISTLFHVAMSKSLSFLYSASDKVGILMSHMRFVAMDVYDNDTEGTDAVSMRMGGESLWENGTDDFLYVVPGAINIPSSVKYVLELLDDVLGNSLRIHILELTPVTREPRQHQPKVNPSHTNIPNVAPLPETTMKRLYKVKDPPPRPVANSVVAFGVNYAVPNVNEAEQVHIKKEVKEFRKKQAEKHVFGEDTLNHILPKDRVVASWIINFLSLLADSVVNGKARIRLEKRYVFKSTSVPTINNWEIRKDKVGTPFVGTNCY
jgi:hypothetical protein